MTRPDNLIVFLFSPVGFGDDTRLFMPFKMVLKIFKEREIVGYLVIRWQYPVTLVIPQSVFTFVIRWPQSAF